MKIARFLAATLAAFLIAMGITALAFDTSTPAHASGGGGSVAGPCGTLTGLQASTVRLADGTLELRGDVDNCSVYLQNYWITFDEPNATGTACRVNFTLFNGLLTSSGSSTGWSTTTNIAPTASGCLGTHLVRAALHSRTDGRLLFTSWVTYTVTSN